LFRNRLFQRDLSKGWPSRESGRAQKCSHRLGNNFGSIAAIAPVLPQSPAVGSCAEFDYVEVAEIRGNAQTYSAAARINRSLWIKTA
jgi:hypothetical protein